MPHDVSPTARALIALEVIQNRPGISSARLGERLGVTERAARRYVAILREAGLPIESVSGPYGGYQVGRSLRLAPLMFTPAEAMGLVMAVLEGHKNAANPADLVGSALAKILRALPEQLAGPVKAVRAAVPAPEDAAAASPELTTKLIVACTQARRLKVLYRIGERDREMLIEPWAVVLRHSYWYLLGWSVTRQARRVLRIDRISAAEDTAQAFTPPAGLDALRTLEEHLSEGWTHPVEVLISAPPEQTARWLPRSLGRLAPAEAGGTVLRATTSEPEWYARQLATLPAPFAVLGSEPIREAVTALGRRLSQAAAQTDRAPPSPASGQKHTDDPSSWRGSGNDRADEPGGLGDGAVGGGQQAGLQREVMPEAGP
jgi:predicted DNA-binding transcriptional regulator YafY